MPDQDHQERTMALKSISTLLTFFLLAYATAPGQITASINNTSSSVRQIQVVEFGDHPDPDTGALRVLESKEAWPAEVESLAAAVEVAVGRYPIVFDIRRCPVSTVAKHRLAETTVTILSVTG